MSRQMTTNAGWDVFVLTPCVCELAWPAPRTRHSAGLERVTGGDGRSPLRGRGLGLNHERPLNRTLSTREGSQQNRASPSWKAEAWRESLFTFLGQEHEGGGVEDAPRSQMWLKQVAGMHFILWL